MKDNKKPIIIIVCIIAVVMAISSIATLGIISLVIFDVASSKPVVTTDINMYNDVIGKQAKKEYKSKWGMSEEIFPEKIELEYTVDKFKMVYYNPWDAQYLAYLVIEFNDDDYYDEKLRLKNYGIEDYIGYYSVSGFSNYELLAMESDDYQGFIYALDLGDNKIAYVEIVFCNYIMDLNYEEYIPKKYLPDGFDAKENNPYRKEKLGD